MTSRDLSRSLQRLALTLEPPTLLQQREANSRAIDRTTGRMTSPALADARDPQTITWKPADTGGDAAVRAGLATLIRAYATTAPTTGDAVITVTKVSEFSGSDPLPTVTIPKGSNFGTAVIADPVEAGAWFTRAVTAAEGASGISVQLVIQPRTVGV